MAVVEVRLDEAPDRPVTIPLNVENLGGADDADHDGIPGSVNFGPGETVAAFEVTAVADDSWEESERERAVVSFGAMPRGVRAGERDATDVFLLDRFVTAWIEFPDGRWVREDAGTLNFTLVGRTYEHHRATAELSRWQGGCDCTLRKFTHRQVRRRGAREQQGFRPV